MQFQFFLSVEKNWNCNSNSFVCRKWLELQFQFFCMSKNFWNCNSNSFVYQNNWNWNWNWLDFRSELIQNRFTIPCCFSLFITKLPLFLMSLVQWNQSEHCLSSFFWRKNWHEVGNTVNSNQFQSIPINSNGIFQWNWNWESEISRNWSELELELSSFWKSKRIGIGIEWFCELQKNWNWNWVVFEKRKRIGIGIDLIFGID